MSWGEALNLLRVLLLDPSAALTASIAGWNHSISRTDLILMDLFDLQHTRWGKKKPKPYPRPWPMGGKTTTTPGANVTQEQIVAALRFAGHTAALPA